MKVGDLLKVTYGSGSGTIGLIISFVGRPGPFGKSLLARLHTGEHFSVGRLEVLA